MSIPNNPSAPQDPAAQPTQPHDPAQQSYSPEYLAETYPSAPATDQAYPQPYQDVQQQPYQPVNAPVQSTTLGNTNTFALLAIIFAFISPLAGIIFGHLSLGQIKRNGDAGRGIGLTGLILSYAYFGFIALFLIFYIGMMVLMFGAMGAAFSDISSFDSYSS